MIKFPTEYEVREVREDQVAAHECNIRMLEMDNHLQTMIIEEQQMVAEPIKGLEEILLDNSRPERMTRIGTLTPANLSGVHHVSKRKQGHLCLEP